MLKSTRVACANLPAGTSKVVSMKKSVSKRASNPTMLSGQVTPSGGAWITETNMAPFPDAPTCERCESSDFLVYENVTLLLDAQRVQPPCWDVEYWCGHCESFYGMLTTHVPDDRQAVRLAAENPRYVRHRVTRQEPGQRTKVARNSRQHVPGFARAE
jgi:hypothetical protein